MCVFQFGYGLGTAQCRIHWHPGERYECQKIEPQKQICKLSQAVRTQKEKPCPGNLLCSRAGVIRPSGTESFQAPLVRRHVRARRVVERVKSRETPLLFLGGVWGFREGVLIA